jgi:hypothetical protein
MNGDFMALESTANAHLCGCGCGQPVKFYGGKYREYARGHNLRVNHPFLGKKRPEHAEFLSGWHSTHKTATTQRTPEVTEKINANPNYIESRKDLGKRNKLKKYREISRKSAKEHFANPEWKEKVWLPKFIEIKEHRPSKCEMEIASIIKELNLPFKYVGDWSYWVGGKNPDFIATDGRKLIIEVGYKEEKDYRFGSWKKYAKNRTAQFKKFKYETKFIWYEDGKFSEKLKKICAGHEAQKEIILSKSTSVTGRGA